jgi:phosphotransferase system IIA component
MPNKNFRCSEETLNAYDKLKQEMQITSDVDMFNIMIRELQKIKNKEYIEKLEIENIKAKYEQDLTNIKISYDRALITIGKLQGELNIYKQQALPKKPEKKWWQIWK